MSLHRPVDLEPSKGGNHDTERVTLSDFFQFWTETQQIWFAYFIIKIEHTTTVQMFWVNIFLCFRRKKKHAKAAFIW